MQWFAATRSVKCRKMELCVLWCNQSGEWTRNSALCKNKGCGIMSELAPRRAWMSRLSWDVSKEVGMLCIRTGYVFCTYVRPSESFGSVSSIYFILLITIAISNSLSIYSPSYIVINISLYYILHSLVVSQQKLYRHLWGTVNYIVVR